MEYYSIGNPKMPSNSIRDLLTAPTIFTTSVLKAILVCGVVIGGLYIYDRYGKETAGEQGV